MAGYVALLRGINVGGHRKIAMADLRGLLAGLGFTGVRTLLNSGNAVFSASGGEPAELAAQIEGALRDDLGMEVRCLVKSGPELHDIVTGNPFESIDDGSRMMVHFLFDTPGSGRLTINRSHDGAPGNVGLGYGVIYQWCPDGLLNAPSLGEVVDGLEVSTTTRNWNTVTKLDSLLS